MKKKIHPEYNEILFVDSSTGKEFVCGMAIPAPQEKKKFEGKEYPVYRLSVSSASHPFFTGENKLVDAEGRVGKFQKKYLKKKEEAVALEAPTPAPKKKTARKKATS